MTDRTDCLGVARKRRGAAFLAIVVVLLLVVVAATNAMVQNEVTQRHINANRKTTDQFKAAIAATEAIDIERLADLRLPVASLRQAKRNAGTPSSADTVSQWIEFEVADDDFASITFHAVLTDGENELDRMTFERKQARQ